MVSMKYVVFGCAVILASMLAYAEATKCFVCNSHENLECLKADPGKLFEKDCADKKGGVDAIQCRKIKQVIEFSVNGLPADTRIIRSCASITGNYTSRCYQRSGFGGRQEVCHCANDLCNGATSVKATFGVLLAAVVVFISRI